MATYDITAHFTIEAESAKEAQAVAAACVEHWDEKTGVALMRGTEGAQGTVTIQELSGLPLRALAEAFCSAERKYLGYHGNSPATLQDLSLKRADASANLCEWMKGDRNEKEDIANGAT